jgi:uncharacterized BrkB/YihY/UPF0761 family membrane protein
MTFAFLPDAHIRWKDVWIGAALTSILFTVGKFLVGLYSHAAAQHRATPLRKERRIPGF